VGKEAANVRQDKFNQTKKKVYLESLRQGLRRGKAAEAAGVSRVIVWMHMRDDPEFAALVDQAELDACEIVEDALFQKARQGNIVACQVWLYNRHPDRWKDQRAINRQDPVDAFLSRLPQPLADQLRQILANSLPDPKPAVRAH
jgi:hypothetical protein